MGRYFEEDRVIRLLKLIQNNNLITLNYIAKCLAVSTKTVKNDIKLINELFGKTAYIESCQNNYKLYIVNKEEFDIIKKELWKHFTMYYFNFLKFVDTKKSKKHWCFSIVITKNSY